MRVTADTNVLVRYLTRDDPAQADAAAQALAEASLVAIPMAVWCELVWVLARGYRTPPAEIAAAIRVVLNAAVVETDRPAVAAGLAQLEAGGDFADGVIAYDGARLGGETLLTFDRAAAAILTRSGGSVRLLG